jgi:hypothetical protein
MIYVVLGMHKSGTSLISQILHHSGINMGEIDPSVSYDYGNKYERQSTFKLNEEILGQRDVNSLHLVAPKKLSLSDEHLKQMRQIIDKNNSLYGQNWGFKDPRTCLVYPLWASVLPEHKLIAIYRHPYELWLRYRPRKLLSRYLKFSLASQLLARWFEYNTNILFYFEESKADGLLLEYQQLMLTQEEFDRLQDFVDVKLNDQRQLGLYRHRVDSRDPIWEFALALRYAQTKQRPEDLIEKLEEFRKR